MQRDPDYIPVDAHGAASDAASTSAFVAHCLLSSRLDAGLPTEDSADEDVNIYLVHLLTAYADPCFRLRVAGYLSAYDQDVFERAQRSRSRRLCYAVYRANADHLLLSVGIFRNPTGDRVHHRPAVFQIRDEVYVGRGKAYYDFASTYSNTIFGRSSGVSEVLNKLALRFETYVQLLSHMRSEYLNFVDRMTEGEIYHLQKASQELGTMGLQDAFLDAYSAYKRQPTPEGRARLVSLAEELHRVDPHFDFEMPS